MSTFEKIKNGIPQTIHIPPELKQLCDWLDDHDYPISGYFALTADDGETMKYWLGFNDVSDRFGIFGRGPDGALYALWIDDDGHQKIVHLGSEGDYLYILAENFVNFLRLLAIGYDELGYADMTMTAQEWNDEDEDDEEGSINPSFIEWVETEFGVKVPQKSNEIVNVDDTSFEEWIEQQLKTYSK